MLAIKKILGHYKTVHTHRKYVRKYCFMCGLYWRGIKHDLSKFSPTEFIESVKYYTGTRSPIDACKEDVGVSKAWLHHRGRNDHHYEYWFDNFDSGGKPQLMSFEAAVEQLCDWIGASIAYNNGKQEGGFQKNYDWYIEKRYKKCKMHPAIQMFNKVVLKNLVIQCDKNGLDASYVLNKRNLRRLYNSAVKFWKMEEKKANDNT